MTQEPSAGSGVKRSNIEAIRRADVEADTIAQGATSSQESLSDAGGDGHDAGRN